MSRQSFVKVEKMSKFWKKANSSPVADFLKEDVAKKRLTSELRNSIRSLHSQYMGKSEISSGEAITNVCVSLEAIFIHGLKGKFTARMSSVFSDVKIPEPDFWPVVMMYSHKDVLSRISNMNQINTDVGRCRSWLRLALNDGLICSYLETMISDNSGMQNFYNSFAYLRDYEHPGIMKQLLEGIAVFQFLLPCNSSTLNVWSSTPLVLAGIWTPPTSPQPVMPAVDVIEFFAEQEDPSSSQDGLPSSADTFKGFKIANTSSGVDASPEPGLPQDIPKDMEIIPDKKIEESVVNETESLPVNAELNVNQESVLESSPKGQSCIIEDKSDTEGSNLSPSGNRLWVESGWSSEFHDEDSREELDHVSYDSLLQSYNKNRLPNEVSVSIPDLTDLVASSEMEEDKSESESLSIGTKSSASDYEFVHKSSLSSIEVTDKRTQQMLSVIDKICPEQGLDLQDYQCHGCGCPIGMIYGKAHRCYFDGYSYCSDCHKEDEYYIPARIIHNWDFKKYPVAKYAKYFLTNIEHEYCFNVKDINPLIYTAFEQMSQLHSLRIQLTFLRSYIFTCKESVVEKLRKKIWPREYLYEHVHMYSLNDLLQAFSGTLQQTLEKVVAFAKKHVLNCKLCKLKAFICEICNNTKVIYPFDIDLVYHCDQCLSVYHKSCMEVKKFCPKCERKRKWKEAPDSSWCLE